MKFKVSWKKKEVNVRCRKTGFFQRISGLMFRSRETDNLLFSFNKDVNIPVHSFFVLFPFLIVWTDKNKKAIEYKIVKPFSLSIKCKRKFRHALEIPINKRNYQLIEFFVGKIRKV